MRVGVRQGRDRPGHPDGAHSDRRRGAGREPEQVNLVSGQTDVSPAEGFTSGSYSIAVGGASIRLVCAEVRALFLERDCRGSPLPGRGAFGRERKISARRQGHRPRLLVDRRRARARPPRHRHRAGQAAVDLRIVGRTLPRLDLPAKVMGAGFIHDIAPDERAACARAAPAVARRASRGARRSGRAQGCAGADRDSARGRFRRIHRRQRDRGRCARPRRRARWRAGRAARRRPPTSARRIGSRRSPRATARWKPVPTDTGHRQPRGRGRLLRPFLTYGSIGTVLRARRIQGRRAQGLVAHPGSSGAARLARARARA